MKGPYSSVGFRLFLLCALAAAGPAAQAVEVDLIGLFPGKAAVFAIDGSQPLPLRIGKSVRGVRLIAAYHDSALIEVDGVRRRVVLGPHHPAASAPSDRQHTVLDADARGHFVTEGFVNGAPVRFLIDTGATMVSLPARDADRLGIDYRRGRATVTHTANGVAYAHVVRLDTVRVGGITLSSVDAIVLESGLDTALLGMSFLNRVEMKNEGRTMTLTRRY